MTHGGAGKCEFVITAREATTLNVSVPAASINEENIPLAGGTTKRYPLSWGTRAAAGMQNNRAIHIRASANIKVIGNM